MSKPDLVMCDNHPDTWIIAYCDTYFDPQTGQTCSGGARVCPKCAAGVAASALPTRSRDARLNAGDPAREPAYRSAEKYIKHFDGHKWLFVGGEAGAGKTFLADAIYNTLRAQGMNGQRWELTALIQECKGAMDTGFGNPIQDCCEVPLLMLDDLGAEPDTAYARSVVSAIIRDRHANRRATLITANLLPESPAGVAAAPSLEQRYDQAIARRVNEDCERIMMRKPKNEVSRMAAPVVRGAAAIKH